MQLQRGNSSVIFHKYSENYNVHFPSSFSVFCYLLDEMARKGLYNNGKIMAACGRQKMMPPTIAQELQEMFLKVIMALQYPIELFSNVTKGTLLQELKGSTAFN